MNISPLELQAIESRLAKNRGEKSGVRMSHATGPAQREAELHEQIRQDVANRGWIGLHGSMAHKTYRTVGEWDWVILADRGRLFLIEVKTTTGKLTAEQLGMKVWAEKLGHGADVVRTFEEYLTVVSI